MEVEALLGEPDVDPRPGVSQMVADLFKAVQIAEEEGTGSRPQRSITELVASEQSSEPVGP